MSNWRTRKLRKVILAKLKKCIYTTSDFRANKMSYLRHFIFPLFVLGKFRLSLYMTARKTWQRSCWHSCLLTWAESFAICQVSCHDENQKLLSLPKTQCEPIQKRGKLSGHLTKWRISHNSVETSKFEIQMSKLCKFVRASAFVYDVYGFQQRGHKRV